MKQSQAKFKKESNKDLSFRNPMPYQSDQLGKG